MEWNKDNKIASINVLQKTLYEAYEKAEKTELVLEADYVASVTKEITQLDITYIGEAIDGLPNGIGKIYYKNKSDNENYYFGYFKDGNFDGRGISETYGRPMYSFAQGSYCEFIFKKGIKNGYCIESSYFAIIESRTDALFIDGKITNETKYFLDPNAYYERPDNYYGNVWKYGLHRTE